MRSKFDFEQKPAYSITMLTAIVASLLCIIGAILIPDIYITISFSIGVIASIIGFLLSVFRSDLIIQERAQKPVLITLIGFTLNYLIYGLALYICLKIEVLNIFACLAGLLLMKILIYVKYGFIDLRKQNRNLPKKEGDNID